MSSSAPGAVEPARVASASSRSQSSWRAEASASRSICLNTTHGLRDRRPQPGRPVRRRGARHRRGRHPRRAAGERPHPGGRRGDRRAPVAAPHRRAAAVARGALASTRPRSARSSSRGIVGCIVVLPTAVETASRGRSLGKLALGLRVVRDDGGAIGFRHAFIRALTGVVEIYLTFGGLAVLVGFLNPSSKRLGDLLAGTHAQVERVPQLPSTAFGVPRRARGLGGDRRRRRGCPTALARRVAAFFANVDHLVPESRARVAGVARRRRSPRSSRRCRMRRPSGSSPRSSRCAATATSRRCARGRAHGRARAGAHGEAGGVPRALTIAGCRAPAASVAVQ